MPLTVSIVVPCLNEQATIRLLLEAIYAQTYPRASLEVIIADGMSTDGTRAEIAAFIATHPDLAVTVVDNPPGSIPAALNRAMQQGRGEIILRLDAHSMPYPDYVERCVADLEAGLGENVGGVWEIRPGGTGWLAESIAVAAAHPLGAGDALYRHAVRPDYVDTVPFGAFKRELLALVGFFDESLLTNEDYEFNVRIRRAGGRIWLDPAIRSVYLARPTLKALARQYFRYGFWKWRMLRRYPDSLRWRQGLPPLFVLSLLGGALLAVFLPLFRYLLAGEILIYAAALLAAGLHSAWQRRKVSLITGLPAAIAVMHLAWGMGFLWSMIKGIGTPANLRRK
jgi:succinoglycan biosynthesis protein ExoA